MFKACRQIQGGEASVWAGEAAGAGAGWWRGDGGGWLEAAGGELPAAAAVPASSTSGQPYTHQGILIQYTHTLMQYTHTLMHVTLIHSCSPTHTLMQSHSSWILIHSAQACHTHTLMQSH